METTGAEAGKRETTIFCCIAGTPIKRWFCIAVLVLLFIALCVVVFAGEPEPPGCDLESGLPATLNLSQEQCKKIQQLADRFRNDSAVIRARIMEKRIELMKVSENPKTDPHNINKIERELNELEHEFARKAQRTEAEQRRVLNPEQINKMRDVPYGYSPQGYGRRGYGRQ